MLAPPVQSPSPFSLAQAPIPQADADRKREMASAWKAYKGQFPQPLKVAKGQPDDNVISNRCAPIVDKGVSFLFGQAIKIEASGEMSDTDEEGNAEPGPIQSFVDGLWGNDDVKMTRLAKMEMNGGVCGQVFVKLIPPTGNMQYPRLVNLDPQNVRMVTDPDDCDTILAFVIEYPAANGLQKRQIIARVDPEQEIDAFGNNAPGDSWTICNYSRRVIGTSNENATWLQVGAPQEWPYPFAPILTTQNLPNPNEPWGIPDLTPDLINLNKVLNFIQSNLSRIIKFHGHPKTVATGVRQSSDISVSIDDVVCLPSESSKIETLAAMENFSGLLAVLEHFMSNMDEQSRVPAVALGRLVDLPKGNISGVALALLFQPLIEKTVLKQRLYGQLICEVTRAALVLAGLIDVAEYEDYAINIHWPNLLPTDDLAAAQTSLIWQQLGVSTSTLLQQAGYSPEDEARKTSEEQARKVTQFSRGQGLPPTPPAQMPAEDAAQAQAAGMGNAA